MSDAIKHTTDDIFLSGRQRIGAHALRMQTALLTSVLLNHTPPPTERIYYKI